MTDAKMSGMKMSDMKILCVELHLCAYGAIPNTWAP